MSSPQASALEDIFADLLEQQQKTSESMPPVHLWHPKLSGVMDMRIDREGRWIHEGGEIRRQSLVKLFSRILRREGDLYFLLTPVEKWQITVDVAPFFIHSASREIRGAQQAIVLNSSTDDQFIVGDSHPLWVDTEEDGQTPVPLVTVRDNLSGLLSRSVYYQLIDWGHEVVEANGDTWLYIASMGQQYRLGPVSD
ncbi:MAG: DUF1285 domain-containing protein [Porticoccaceae bacterium]